MCKNLPVEYARQVNSVKPKYDDILERITEAPTWYDECGTPRYGEFKPNALGVYDDLAVLLAIECQECGAIFKVGLGRPRIQVFLDTPEEEIKPMSLTRFSQTVIYGDPPRHDFSRRGACHGGDTMSAIERQVLEAWEEIDFEWVRVPILEGMLDVC